MLSKGTFQGQTCVITGAASGIGYALAECLLQCGARVVIADRDIDGLSAASSRLNAISQDVFAVPVDVTSDEQVRQLISAAVSRFDRIDYLFNNAGVGGTVPIEQATLEHWKRIVDINLWGVIHGVTAVLPRMRSQGSGHIVNTSSISGLIPVPGQALYNTTKYAVVGLSESLRLELEPYNIAVTVICPGPVASRIWGTPIIGERVERTPPANAIPATVAAKIILAAVARREGIVALPSKELWGWRSYRWLPRLAERALRAMVRARHATESAR